MKPPDPRAHCPVCGCRGQCYGVPDGQYHAERLMSDAEARAMREAFGKPEKKGPTMNRAEFLNLLDLYAQSYLQASFNDQKWVVDKKTKLLDQIKAEVAKVFPTAEQKKEAPSAGPPAVVKSSHDRKAPHTADA